MRSVSKLTQGGSKGNVTLFTENDRHTAMYVNEISCGCTTRFREVRAVHKKANVVRRRRAHEGWYEAWRHALNLDRSNLGAQTALYTMQASFKMASTIQGMWGRETSWSTQRGDESNNPRFDGRCKPMQCRSKKTKAK
jgi:hypothetical protein